MHSYADASSESQPSLSPANSFMNSFHDSMDSNILEVTLCWVMLNSRKHWPQAMCPV